MTDIIIVDNYIIIIIADLCNYFCMKTIETDRQCVHVPVTQFEGGSEPWVFS